MEDCKRVLQITYSLKAAGIETFVVNLYKAIDKEKLHFDFVSYYNEESDEFYDKIVRQLGGCIYKLGFAERRKILNNLKARYRLYKVIKTKKYDIVHIHGSSGIAVLEAIIAKLAGTKRIIIHSHSSNIADHASFGKIQRLFTYFAKCLWNIVCSDFLACSSKAAEWLYSKKQCLKTIIIPNGIFTEAFYPDSSKYYNWRRLYNIDNTAMLIGHVGSFTTAKNHPYILEIFRAVYILSGKVKFVLIGDGPYRKKIEAEIMHSELKDKVIFTGVSDKVPEWMNACDVLILPSFYEGFPVVCVEAQYTGTPIIVSDVITKETAISEDIYYMNINDAPSIWAQKILTLKKTFNCTVHLSDFDIKSVASKIEKIYLRGTKCI